MKKILALSCCAFLVAAPALRAADGMFADLKFDDAKAEAARDHKIILIDFFTTWCGPCKMLDKQTWANREVMALVQSKAVPLKLDAEKETNLAAVYHIEAYPTVMLLRPDGSEIDRLVGFRDPKAFMADFNSTLAGKDSLTRAKEALKAGGDDPMSRMQYARALAQKQKYPEALKEYLWCFDNGTKDPSFVGVRASFLLSELLELGRDYPAARQALEQRRNQDTERIRSGSATTQEIFDVMALNRTLGEPEKNIGLFDSLAPSNPARSGVIRLIFDDLLQAHRYRDLVGASDPLTDFERQVQMFNQMLPMLQKQAGNSAQLEQMQRHYTVGRGAGFFEALAGVTNNQAATALAQKILQFDSSAETRQTLIEAANRAGNPILAEEMKSAK